MLNHSKAILTFLLLFVHENLKKRLSKTEVDTMLNRMPKLSKNDEGFFRGLGNKGLISFSEYLFLLTILIKPQVFM